MVSDSQVSIALFLKDLAQGFVHTRPEIILFFLILVASVAAIGIFFLLQNRRARVELARRSREIVERLIHKLELNEQETALLGRLVRYLEPGDTPQALLVSAHLFDACVRRMGRAELVSEPTLNALRLKIGFRITQDGEAPSSTAEIPPGSPLLIALNGGARTRGSLLAQGAGAMLVKLEPGAPALARGMGVTMYFHNSAGIFSFPSRVTDLNEDAVFLAQSSQITHQQRRKYFRKKEFLPVFIAPLSTETEPRESMLLDLSGGGASLQNPQGLLKKGDQIELSLFPWAERLTLAARVVRVSKNGRVANVRFESLTEAERNRIMGFIFTGPSL
jgi:hypothetical protein